MIPRLSNRNHKDGDHRRSNRIEIRARRCLKGRGQILTTKELSAEECEDEEDEAKEKNEIEEVLYREALEGGKEPLERRP